MLNDTDKLRRSQIRFDLFISFPGSQRLASLGFTGLDLDCNVRDLARSTCERLRNVSGRSPSVFYDHDELRGNFGDELAEAVLQTRGGGVALILLTAEYLRRKYCLAELRAFLELAKLKNSAHRKNEAVEIRIVVLEPDAAVIKSVLRDSRIGDFVRGFSRFQHISVKRRVNSTRSAVVEEICEPVLRFWRENQSLCLGRSQTSCLAYLQGTFCCGRTQTSWLASLRGSFSTAVDTPLSEIAGALEVRYIAGMTLDEILSHALRFNKLSAYNLDMLASATSLDVLSVATVRAYRRKWVSDGWPWRIEDVSGDVSLLRFIEEAGDALAGTCFNNASLCAGKMCGNTDYDAVSEYLKAAEGGNVHAMRCLGDLYRDGVQASGSGVTRSYADAVSWYRKGTVGGCVRAMTCLGFMYDKGLGVSQSDFDAVVWYRKAADGGHDVAMYNLGLMYHQGRGVSQGDSDAVAWYRKASDGGHADAMCCLGRMYEKGSGVSQSDSDAVAWYRKAANRDCAIAMYNLGVMYAQGRGVSQSDSDSVAWYRGAAGGGDADAIFKIFVCYRDGRGVAQSDSEAQEWLRKLATCHQYLSAENRRAYNDARRFRWRDLADLAHQPSFIA